MGSTWGYGDITLNHIDYYEGRTVVMNADDDIVVAFKGIVVLPIGQVVESEHGVKFKITSSVLKYIDQYNGASAYKYPQMVYLAT